MSTVALTKEQYTSIITALIDGIPKGEVTSILPSRFECVDGKMIERERTLTRFVWVVEPNEAMATMLQVEANTGIRISDVLKLKRGDIIKDGDRYRFDIVEQKTKKARHFTVPTPVFLMVEKYCVDHDIEKGEKIFPYDEARSIQRIIKKIADFFGYENISTHSFRKYFATKAYQASGNDIELVSRLLQHSSSSITRAYIGIQDERTENVLKASVSLI